MDGYRVDPAAIGAAGGALRGTADTLSAARDQLDAGVCAAVGPGRLGAAAAGLSEDARRDLDRVLGAVLGDAELANAAARGYADHDQAAAETLRGQAGD